MVNKDLKLDSRNHFKHSNNICVLNVATRLAELSWMRVDTVDCGVIFVMFHEDFLCYSRPLLESYADGRVEYSRFSENPSLIIASFEVLPF